jgi:NAD(P)-dependent dehydrogenase (short-subunit alcohol dehydrogenase family)
VKAALTCSSRPLCLSVGDEILLVMVTETRRQLSGMAALVAGATGGAGRAIAVELACAGAFVYATGRSSRADGPSEIGRPETIEETGELITAAGGEGVALRVDHLEPGKVQELAGRIDARPWAAGRPGQ